MQTKFKKIALAVILLSVISAASFYIVDTRNKAKEKELSLKKQDITKYIRENNSSAAEAHQSALSKDYNKALEISLNMFQNAKSPEEKAFAEFSVADTYLILKKREEASKTYVSIFKNNTYDKYTRVAAMNSVMQQYAGSGDRKYLDMSLPEVKDLSSYDAKLYVYKKMYEVQPTAQAIAFVGGDTFNKLDQSKKAEAKALFDNYIKEMDYDIEIQARGVGSNHLVPNLIMSKAILTIIVFDKFKISSLEEISFLYEEAIKKAREKLNPITEQFALLNYSNFLAKHKQTEKAAQVFNIFALQKTTEMVENNLKGSTLEKRWPGIKILYDSNPTIKKYLDDKNVKAK